MNCSGAEYATVPRNSCAWVNLVTLGVGLERDQPKVDHFVHHLAGLEPVRDDVLRLQIAMDDPGAVRQVQRGADRGQQMLHRGQVEPIPHLQLLVQARPVQVLHHEVGLPLGIDVEVENRDDVRVAQLRAGAALAQEALAPDRRVGSRSVV